MNSKYVATWTVPLLFLGCALANAQAPRAAAAPAAPGVTSHLVSAGDSDQPASDAPASTVADSETPTAGHDAATGKDEPSPNLSSPDGTQVAKATTRHPDFMALDLNNHGYLTPDDVRHNGWLSNNFSRCDVDHDGRLSQQEYANCK